MNPITPELVLELASEVEESAIPQEMIIEPTLNNGISEELRELFSCDREYRAGVNEILSVLNK